MKSKTPHLAAGRAARRCSVRTRDAIASIRKRRCPLCGGEWRADVMPNDLGDSIPELGLQECIFCGAIWNTNEDAAGEELRGGCGLFVRGPSCTPNPEGLRTRHLVEGTQHPLVGRSELKEE